MSRTNAYAAFDKTSPLKPHAIERREPGASDVAIEILFCGVCHSDVHQVRNEWHNTVYPIVPGHEIVGKVTKVGPSVKKFAVGDTVGVGCLVDSCRTCGACTEGLEQYCAQGVATYNALEKDGKTVTFGGYSTAVVVHEDFVLKVRSEAPLEKIAPLLCAGITTYSPLRHWEVGKGSRVAIVGLGGLGHMGVKLAAAMGADDTLLSSSPSKKADAARLGAHDFVVTSERGALQPLAGRFDFILDTVSAPHDLSAYLQLVKRDGTMVLVGAPEKPSPLAAFPLIMQRRSLAGSLIGGLPETQEMLDFCADHGVTADVETIPMQEIDRAYERMLKSDVRYRFVIDLASLR